MSLLADLAIMAYFSTAGDLLRAEQIREGSPHRATIEACMVKGRIVPDEITVKLLENSMQEALSNSHIDESGWSNGKGRFLVDGFPRNLSQMELFENTVR